MLTTQYFLNALKNEDYAKFLLFDQYLNQKYRTLFPEAGADQLLTILTFELTLSDLTLDDIRNALYFFELLPNCRLAADREAYFVTIFISASLNGYFIKHKTNLLNENKWTELNRENIKEMTAEFNSNLLNEAFENFLKKEYHQLTDEVNQNKLTYLKNHLLKFLANYYGLSSSIFMKNFFQQVPMHEHTVVIDQFIFDKPEVKQAFKSKLIDYYLEHSYQIFESQLIFELPNIKKETQALIDELKPTLPENYQAFLTEKNQLAKSPFFKSSVCLRNEHFKPEECIDTERNNYDRLNASYPKLKANMDNRFKKEILPELVTNLEKEAYKQVTLHYKKKIAKAYLHLLKSYIMHKDWHVGFICRQSININGDIKKVPNHVKKIYELCLASENQDADYIKLCKDIHLIAKRASHSFSLFRKTGTSVFYKTLELAYDQQKIKGMRFC